ncbi:class GN sortase [Enterovibrio sp. FF113]|uniref:class GN sortase n=1 Tax=Enterovibrio sp. FF113 TaxID=3230010 RepID=UPI00352F3F73
MKKGIRRFLPQTPAQCLLIGTMTCGAILMANGLYIKAKAQLAQVLISHAWEQQKLTGDNHKPWPWADTYPIAKLSMQDQTSNWVLSGANARNLAFGPTLQTQTAAPGRKGNVVVFGHNDTHFSGLASLALGDELNLETRAGTKLYYQVTNVAVVHESETEWAANTADDRITLITCYPFDSLTFNGPMRYIVVAKPIDPEIGLDDFSPTEFYTRHHTNKLWL